MIKQEIRKPKVQKRHKSLRVKLEGTTEFPRLAVYRSTKHIYAQVIDDEKHVTVCSASSLDKDLKAQLKHGGNIEAAKVVGEAVAKKALKAGVEFLANKLGECIIILVSERMVLVKVSDGFVKSGVNAGKLVGEIARATGANGGGRPNFAQGGIKDSSKIDDVLTKVESDIKSAL